MSKPAALLRLPSSVIPCPVPSSPSPFASAAFPLITAPFHRSRSRLDEFRRQDRRRDPRPSPFLPRDEQHIPTIPAHARPQDNQRIFSVFFPVAESLVQELELERKSRQHQAAERDQVKSPLQGGFADSTSSPSISAKYLTWIESRCKNYADRF